MTIPDRLARCRAELERQKAVEGAATEGPWERWENVAGSGVTFPTKQYGGNETLCGDADVREIVQARNHDKARLAVVREQLGWAQDCWNDTVNDVPDDTAEDANSLAEIREQLYDGSSSLTIAERLLGLEAT